MQEKRKKIILTGGHAATTALAVVEELVRRDAKEPFWDIYWIGAEKALEGKKVPTLESLVFPKVGVKTYSISAGRVQRRLTLWTIPSILKIPVGFIQAVTIVRNVRPDIILSFGGFAAFPVVLAGWLSGVPVVIHDQTAAVGLANRVSSFFVTKIALAREESREFFPAAKCVVVGNPILTQVREIKPKEKIGEPPVIFITTGSRGSQRVNSFIDAILPELLEKFRVIHITGSLDYEKFIKRKNALPDYLKKNYEPESLIDPMKIDNVYRESDIIVARAGANTVSEIIATKRPAILIPIPWSYKDEQTKNAIFAKEFGIATVIPENELSATKLLTEIERILGSWYEIVDSVAPKKSPDEGAAGKLVDLIYQVLQNT